ncbi:TonB-dependent receptor [Limnohabitans sp.]|uniref:TonB-dependent receptor domain-containing protein n=1 Tax=Limnohabitans sp. TaxID=1907725 RepID=UPI00333FB8B9
MKNRSIRARSAVPVFSALSLAVVASLQAQTMELNPVVVSATRIQQKISDVIPSATVITREEIERSQAPTLVDLIQGQPGIEIGRNGGPGTLSSIFMRGQASSNVAVFIDGIPVQRDAGGGLKLVDIPPSQIEKVEILRGNMSALYGESAVGGAIHIFTLAGAGKSGPTGSLAFGSRNTSNLTAGYNLNGDDFKLGISVQKFKTDGFSAMNPRQSSLVNPDKDAFERESFFINGEKRVSKDLAIGFQANSIDSKVDYDGTNGSTVLHNSKQKSSDLTVYSRIHLSSVWTSRIAMTQSGFSNREFRNITTPNGSFDGDQLGIQWGNTYKLGTGNANFGVDVTNAEFKTPTKFERDSLGYYVGYSGRFDRLDYQANLRRDEIKSKEGNTAKENSANTWLLGAGYQLTHALKLTSLVSTSFRAPAVGELFGAWGNPTLQPQEHKGGEFGLQHQSAIGRLRAVYFNTETKNDFAYGTDSKPYNIAKSENKGIELSLNGNAAGWGYRLSAVAQDPKNAESGARLARRAKEYGSIGLTKTAMGVDWGGNIILSGNRKDSDYNSEINSSFTVVNLTASKKLTREWTGRIRVENAFNENYQLAHGYNTPLRGVFVTLQYQPK